MNTQAVSKVIFLIFVVIMAAYIMMTNKTPIIENYEDKKPVASKKEETKPTEQSANPVAVVGTKSMRQTIVEIYKELYGADPKEDEVQFYVKFFNNKQSTRDYMREIISTSAPTLQKTLKAGNLPLIPDSPQGTEDEVIQIYTEILDRNPDAEELQYYSTYIKQGASHVEKMKIMLLQSQEYKRLQKTQNNVAYGHLLGGITDRQLTIMVTNVYNSLTKKGDKIDDETLKFLKKKYLEFQLNEAVFRKFVKDYVLFNPTSVSKTVQSNQLSQSSTSTTNASQRANSSVTDNLAANALNTTATTTNAATTGSTTASSTSSTAKAVSETYTNNKSSTTGVDTSKMIQNIKTNADCQFDKNKLDNTYKSNSQQALASTIHNRNRDELKNICQRNNTYSKYHDEDMVVLPGQEWTIPQKHTPVCSGRTTGYNPLVEQTSLIGTLISDAKDTQVGSIMPKFVYREYYD